MGKSSCVHQVSDSGAFAITFLLVGCKSEMQEVYSRLHQIKAGHKPSLTIQQHDPHPHTISFQQHSCQHEHTAFPRSQQVSRLTAGCGFKHPSPNYWSRIMRRPLKHTSCSANGVQVSRCVRTREAQDERKITVQRRTQEIRSHSRLTEATD